MCILLIFDPSKVIFWVPESAIWVPKKSIWMGKNACFGWFFSVVDGLWIVDFLFRMIAEMFWIVVILVLDEKSKNPQPKSHHPELNF